MKLPAIAISRWAINSNGDVYRSDGYVGIGTDSPSGLLGLGDEFTYIDVNGDGEITFTDAVNGTTKLSELGSFYDDTLIAPILNATDNQGALDALKLRPATATLETLTFSVDYNLSGAVNPPTGVTFSKQEQIDAYLAAAGTTSFKDLDLVVASIPHFVLHGVTINLAAGTHRPISGKSSSFAWDFVPRMFAGGSITVQGPAASTWPALFSLSGLTITASSAVAGDPYIEFSGTPFSGLELRGLYAVLSDGQALLIHRHTSNRLYVTSTISPAPTNGVTTATVARPSALMRNSLTDTVRAYFFGINILGSRSTTAQRWILSDISFEGYGQLGFIDMTSCNVQVQRVVLDHLAHHSSVASNGWGFNGKSTTLTLSRFAWRAPTITSGPDGSFLTSHGEFFISASSCYFGGGDRLDGCEVGRGMIIRLTSNVFDDHRIHLCDDGIIDCGNSNSAGLYNIVRNIDASALGGLVIDGGGWGRYNVDNAQRLEFELCAAPCVLIRGATSPQALDATRFGGPWFVNGAQGGNTDYGIKITGQGSSVKLPSTVSVSGSLGEFDFAGNTDTYTNLTADGPYVDLNGLNILEKL